MKTANVDIQTRAGTCDAYIASPDGAGPHPGVLLYMDAFGLRPYLFDMAKMLADQGYYVLVPNVFYRDGRAPVVHLELPLRAEDRPRVIEQLTPLIRGMTPERAALDATTFLNFLGRQVEVRPGSIGAVGYCMGGALALRVAAQYPERVAAAASIHGGYLATDAVDSPHRLVRRMKGELYIAHADQDPSATPDQIEKLRVALEEAGIPFEAEVYAGATHGFTMRDMPPYNEAACKRHWPKLFALFERRLVPNRN